MKRCTLLIADPGQLNSLWVGGRLDLLLRLDMLIVIVDAVYDEATIDARCPKDADIKDFVDRHRPPFSIEETQIRTPFVRKDNLLITVPVSSELTSSFLQLIKHAVVVIGYTNTIKIDDCRRI